MILNVNNIYRPTFKLYQYSGSLYRIVFFPKREKGWEKVENEECYKDLEFMHNESLRTSLSRSRRAVREYIACNNFKYFVTLTINSINADRFNLQECQDLLRRLIHNYSRQLKYANKKEGLDYVLVTEKHENGAFHFHGVFSDMLKSDIFVNDNGYLDSKYFSKNLGFFSMSEIKDKLATALYITKYITKDSVINDKGRHYFCSKGLNKPVSYEIKLEDLRYKKIPFYLFNNKISNDFCKVRDFDYNDLDKNSKFFLWSNFTNNPMEF